MNAPGGRGESANAYHAHDVMLRSFEVIEQLFKQHPRLQATKVCFQNGHIEVLADGGAGVVHDWVHALPDHREMEGLAVTAYGGTQAVVLTQESITVTVRPPFGGVRA